jgi:hypothetical protein
MLRLCPVRLDDALAGPLTQQVGLILSLPGIIRRESAD